MGEKYLETDGQNPCALRDVMQDEDDIFEKILFHVGPVGRFQKLIFLMMLPLGYTSAFTYLVQMFITVTPENYWCRIPELANLSMELRKYLSVPGSSTGAFEHCLTFDTNWTRVLETLAPPPEGTPMIKCQHGWEFELSDIPYQTVTSERDWVCDRGSYVPTAQSVFFVGSVIGTTIFGWVADRFGRVPAIIASNLVGGICGIATSFTSGVWDFMLCRFLMGLSYDNSFMVLYVLVLEYVGSQYRTLVANLAMAFHFSTAGILLPWLAYYIANWRVLQWVTSAPMFLVLLTPWLLPESVRWLTSRGRIDEAIEILHKFENINRKKIPNDVMNKFKIFANAVIPEEKYSIFKMFKSSQLRKAMIGMTLLFMGCAIVFDGSVRLWSSFGLNFFAVFSATEFIAIILVIVILDRFGRRTSTFSTALISASCLIASIFTPKGIPKATLVIVARLFITKCFTSIMQWCTEIIPTPYRASGVLLLHTSGFSITILSPFIVFSEQLWVSLPMVIFTATAFAVTGLCLTLPETKGLSMPQTMDDAEKIFNEYSLFRRRWLERTTCLGAYYQINQTEEKAQEAQKLL